MSRLNKILLIVFAILVIVAGISTVTADLDNNGAYSASEGSGRIMAGDESPTQENYYSGESNTGDIASEDNNNEDPLDEEYYDSDEGDDGGVVSLSKHATGFPIFLGLLSCLMSIGILLVKK